MNKTAFAIGVLLVTVATGLYKTAPGLQIGTGSSVDTSIITGTISTTTGSVDTHNGTEVVKTTNGTTSITDTGNYATSITSSNIISGDIVANNTTNKSFTFIDP